jgi:hypothetical protein
VNILCALFVGLSTWELLGAFAVLLTLLGIWLWWHLQSHRSDVEEAAKDGEITGEQAHGKIKLIEVRALFCICVGLALMLVAALKLLQ